VGDERVEASVPVVGEGGEELLGDLDRFGVQAVADPAAFARLGSHQARIAQEREMFGDRLGG
jgi:hypothetical protein